MAGYLRILICGITLSLSFSLQAKTGLLYVTEFEEFNPGPNLWAGQHDWFSNPAAGSGNIQGIDHEFLPDLGKSGFLGFETPSAGWNFIAQPINHNPTTEGTAKIEIDTLIGLEDSTNERYDSFFVGFYNIQGDFLAAIQFSNERESFGIYYDDGVTVRDTTVDFIHGELSLLAIDIDFQNNQWSGEFDGIPLFTKVPFTASGKARTLGSLAYEWIVTDDNPAMAGNNWLLVADLSVWAIPPSTPVVETSGLSFTSEKRATFQITGEVGWTYQVEYTNSLGEWLDDLPNSTFVITEPRQIVTFIDEAPLPPDDRFYRVRRIVTP